MFAVTTVDPSPVSNDNGSTSTNTSSMTNSTDGPGTCSDITYTGQICTEYLDPCRVDSFVSTTDDSISLLFGLFDTEAKDQTCKDSKQVVQEFICHIAFPRCDNNLITHLPNKSHCEYIRDTLCPNDWVTIQLLAGSLLPNCSNLPALSIEPTCIGKLFMIIQLWLICVVGNVVIM